MPLAYAKRHRAYMCCIGNFSKKL